MISGFRICDPPGGLTYSDKITRERASQQNFDARCALPGMRMGVRALPADVGPGTSRTGRVSTRARQAGGAARITRL